MDLYKALALKTAPGRDEPSVWVHRLVIYEKIAPEPVVIREVGLARGLNIVWAEESERDDTAAAITGHSAGKTSFCRLLRYVLGERTFGTKANMALIESAFPAGYVGAELNVRGQRWAVIRPIGKGRSSYLRADATIEDLIADRSGAASQEEYPEKLGLNALLDELETGAVVRTKQPIEWGHLLAWCTRDQEARFQNSYDWRSPRSESEWPSFRASKADALFVMRTLLGLFLPDELKGEEQLAELLQKHEQLEKRLVEVKREPEFRVNLYDQALRTRLRSVFPDEHGIDSVPLRWDELAPDLHRLTDKAVDQLQAEITAAEDEITRFQTAIDTFGAAISRKQEEYRSVAAAFGLDTSGLTEIAAGLSQSGEQLELIQLYQDKMCPYGGVLIGQCDYVIRRRESLKFTQLQDAQALEQAEAKRRDTQKTLDEQQRKLASDIKKQSDDRLELQRKRDALLRIIDEKRAKARNLVDARRELVVWTEKRSKPGEFKELDDCNSSLKDAQANIEKLSAELTRLTAQHEESSRLLSSIFSGAVRAVLSSGTYDGQATLKDRELGFYIVHGSTMSGEAVETLSILLADVVCLIYNSVSDKARLPGFLVHDSPREADLGLGIYRSFIRFIAALQQHFGSAERCPFQYLITTTTAPPEELRSDEYVKLHLNAASPEKLLFGRVIAPTANAATLLWSDGDAQ